MQRPDAVPHYLGRSYALLLVPLTATMAVVVWTVANVSPLYDDNVVFRGSGGGSDDDTAAAAASSSSQHEEHESWLAIALPITLFFLVGSVVAVSVVLLLYKYRCNGALLAMHATSLAVLFVPRAWMWLDLVCTRFQLPYDAVTMTVLVLNVAAGAFVAILYYAPAVVRQVYTVALAVVVAWTMLALPAAVVWCLLLVMAVYDLFAVLSPCGPLRMLVNLVAKRGEALPAFVYSSDSARVAMVSHDVVDMCAAVSTTPHASPSAGAQEVARGRGEKAVQCGFARGGGGSGGDGSSDEEAVAAAEQRAACGRMPIALGLGDFIFFGVLVGKASVDGVLTCGLCSLAVLAGMVGTLLLLLVCAGRLRGLPALPFSIFLGVAVYVACCGAVMPLSAYTMASMAVL